MQVKKQQLELDVEQQTFSKLGKDYIKAVYWHPAYLNYMHGIKQYCALVNGGKVAISSLLHGLDIASLSECPV